jgi:hypothetical protein
MRLWIAGRTFFKELVSHSDEGTSERQSGPSVSEYEPGLRDIQLVQWNSHHFLHNSYTVRHSMYNIMQKRISTDLSEI